MDFSPLNIFIAAIFVSWLLYMYAKRMQNEKLTREKIEKLKKMHKNTKLYITSGAEQIDKNLVQFYGQPYGVSITPGMKLTLPDGSRYPIKEVYADDASPDKPDQVIPETNKHTAILIETKVFNWNSFTEAIKREKILPLRIES